MTAIKRLLGVPAAAVAALMLVTSPPVLAAAPTVATISGNPLTIYVGSDASYQVINSQNPGNGQFYPTDSAPGPADAGWFIVGASTLYGPDFNEHADGTATDYTDGSGTPPYASFSPVSLSAVTGSGTQSDPFKVTVVVGLGSSGLQGTLVISYVNGDNYYQQSFTLHNGGGSTQAVKIFNAGDIYLADSDAGIPYLDTASQSPGGKGGAVCGSGSADYFILLVPETTADVYTATDYPGIWNQIAGGSLDGQVEDFMGSCRDNAAGLQWNRSLPAGQSTLIQTGTSFGDIPSITQFSVTQVAPASGVAGTTVNGVTITGTGFTASTTFDFGAGITVGNLVITNDHSATATLTIDPTAALGARDVVGTQASGGRTSSLHNGFTVVAPPPPGSVQFSAGSYTVDEGAGTVTISVTRIGGSAGAASVDYATASGTATSPADFTATSGTLSWADGDSATKTIIVPIIDDALVEGNESFTVALSNASVATLGTTASATVTITDNDTTPPPVGSVGSVQFNAANYTVDEGAGTVTISVTRIGGNTGAASVQYATANGSADAPGDFTATSGTLNWADGDSATKTITVPIIDDTLVESSESFTVALSNPATASLGTTQSTTVTITDNDQAPPSGTPGSVQFDNANYSVNEGVGTVTIHVTRTGGSNGAASISYATVNGTAVAPGDFTATNGTLSWADGDGATKTITVPIIDDSIVEGNESFTVALSNPSTVTLGATHTVTVTITDNDHNGQLLGPVTGGGGGSFGVLTLAGLLALGLLRLFRWRGIALLAVGMLALGMATIPQPAMAASFGLHLDRAYGGVRVGDIRFASQHASDIERRLAADGDVATVTLSQDRIGGVVFAGVPIYRNLALEVSYVELGNFKARVSGSAVSLEKLTRDTAEAMPLSGRGATFGLRWELPLIWRLSLEPRVGAFLHFSKREAHSAAGSYSDSDIGVGANFGVSLLLHLVDGFYLGGGGEYFWINDHSTLTMVSGELEYRFGG